MVIMNVKWSRRYREDACLMHVKRNNEKNQDAFSQDCWAGQKLDECVFKVALFPNPWQAHW